MSVAIFETMLVDGGRVPLWPRHLERWQRSVAAFGLDAAASDGVRTAAVRSVEEQGWDRGVVRWTTDCSGSHLAVRPFEPPREPVTLHAVTVADAPGDHKFVERDRYDAARATASAADADDALLIAPDGAVLETAVANVFFEFDGEWVTPRLDGRVLPGVARRWVTEVVPVVERVVAIDEVDQATAIVVTNAVHGPRTAELSGFSPARRDECAIELQIAWRGLIRG